ncbi:hypothetical protein LX32DRAFT_634190 [Colletotrichum zoysiae]|uniref:Uncharacterized protein n=1 Tax=Colletotrichum zoysiae TaxID=1216348 RepID=A0AAD9HTA5_9PEZI|nr:hypothetical protein LX32DRAFT_634190 [Colletotrichum zoysiae]
MPVKKLDGTPGLLASSKLGETVDAEFPDLTHAIDQYKDNLPVSLDAHPHSPFTSSI